jgi:hypothetical protein
MRTVAEAKDLLQQTIKSWVDGDLLTMEEIFGAIRDGVADSTWAAECMPDGKYEKLIKKFDNIIKFTNKHAL